MDEAGKDMEHYGYDGFFESGRKELGLSDMPAARVISEQRGSYVVVGRSGERVARVTGKKMFTAAGREDYPAVGDWVALRETDGEHAVIVELLPRKTIIKRSRGDKGDAQVIGANIDIALVVEAVDRDYNLNRIERYFALAKDGGVKPAVVLNKTDLISKEELDSKLLEIRGRFGGDTVVIPTSVTGEFGLNELRAYISPGKTYCFLGSSGVGKSSLINQLIGESRTKTGSIGEHSGRGRHVTTNRHMYFLESGGIVIDNPGMREVGMADTEAGIVDQFDEITALAGGCRYADCTHMHEPGCEVLSALDAGRLDAGKYANYINLKKEADFYEMNELEKKQKDRQFGKLMKNAKKDFGDRGFKDY